MIRIAYLIIDLEIGGSERVVERLATHLDPAVFDPLVISLTSPGPVGASIARAGVPVIAAGAKGSIDLRALRVLLKTIRKFRPDILHAFLFHANQVARFIKPLTGRPKVIASHRTLEGGARHWSWERLGWGLCDRIVCASEAVRNHLHEASGVPEDRALVIYNGVPERNEVSGGNVISTASRLDPGKGVDDVIRAAEGLGPLRIIGDGSDRARLQALAPGAEFTGAVEDISNSLSGSAVFVHASHLGEGMPNAVLEAMACGLPVVATDVGGTREVVIEGETGYLVSPGDVVSIRDRVADLLKKPEEARRMGRRGRSLIAERFSLERMVKEYVSLYLELAG